LNKNVEVPGQPIQLIKQDVDGNFIVQTEALNILNNLDGNIAVCDIVGPYRSGKSFIMNLLLNRKKGFTLGSTYVSCTRGIWMWDTPIKHRNRHGEFNLILLDTEGLSSPDSETETDNKIFVLSLLLSSLFLYNTKGVIDRDAIKKLAIMTDLSNFINSSIDDSENDSLYLNSPDFIWTVRDFFLNLEGRAPKQYLLSSLELETSRNNKNKDIQDANIIRDLIKKSFKSLDCFCLPLPIENGLNGMEFDETLQNLDSVNFDHLRKDFKHEITKLCENIKRDIGPKIVHTIPLTAVAFASYIQIVVNQLNKNERVSLTESLTLSIQYASEKALKDSIENYKTKMQDFVAKNPLPLKWDVLDEADRKIMESCFKMLQVNLNGTNDLTRPILERFTREIYQYHESKLIGGLFYDYHSRNSESIKLFNKNLLNKLWKNEISDVFFENTIDQDTNVGQKFIEAYERLKQIYCSEAFFNIDPEMSEAFNEWYKEKDIVNVINNMKYLGEQVRQKIEKEERLISERAERERLEKDLMDEKQKTEEARRQMEDKIEEIQGIHERQISALEEKLNEAENNGKSAQEQAEITLRQLEELKNEMKNSNKKSLFSKIGEFIGEAVSVVSGLTSLTGGISTLSKLFKKK
jgi:hypothetical protein